MRKSSRDAMLLMVCMMLASHASAQIYDLDFGAMMLNQNISSVVTYTANTNHIAQEQAYSDRKSSARSPTSRSASHDPVDFSVSYERPVSDDVRQRFISAIRKANGDRIASLIDASFSSRSVRDSFRDLASPYGLHADDYGDVFTAYLVTLWMVANQVAAPSASAVRAVNAQTHATLAHSGLEGSQRERQMTAERMMYELVSATYGSDEARRVGDVATLARMATLARAKFFDSGLDLQAMAIGDGGMVRLR